MYLAAVYSNGHVATGRHHGEAFSKLSSEDQESDLVSGHVNSDGTFTTEMDHMNKEVILIRHAESMWNAQMTEDLDSPLTFKGVSQAQASARFINKNIDCRNLAGYTSPYDRCLLTSMPIRKHTGIRLFVRPEIAELTDHYPDDGVEVVCRQDKYLDIEWGDFHKTTFKKESSSEFLSRLRTFLESLPDRSLVITHGSVVQTLIEMLLGIRVKQVPAWDNSITNASVTYIKNGTVIWLAKKIMV